MKILIMINGWTTKMSGGDYHILKVAKRWSDDHEIFYLLPALGYKYAKKYLDTKYFIYSTPFEVETNNIFGIMVLYIFRILKVLLSSPKEKFDIVIASSHFLYDTIPALFMHFKNPSCNLVAFCHGSLVRYSKTLRGWIRIISDFFFILLAKRFFHLVFTINPLIKETLIKRGVDDEKIVVTSNGVDNINFVHTNVVRKEFDGCFMGRLVESKGIFDLVEIWKNVIEKRPNSKLIIIGDGPKMCQLKNLIKTKNLDNKISISGYLEDDEKFKAIRMSKLFLLPSYAESSPIVIIEAMSCGLPVICYDLPELRVIWHNNVTWVAKGDKKAFAEAVLNLLNNEKNYYQFLRFGIEQSKEHTWEKIAKKEINFIKTLDK